MALDRINLGDYPNDGTGDNSRDAFAKVNEIINKMWDTTTSGISYSGEKVEINGTNTGTLIINSVNNHNAEIIFRFNGITKHRLGLFDTTDRLGFARYDSAGSYVAYSMNIANDTGNVYIGGSSAATEKLEVSGNVKCVSLIETSDKMLKKDINVLNKGVDGLRPVSYRLKQTGDFHYGFIAQDMLETHPELVKGTGKKDKEGNIDYYSIKRGDIIALLVKEVQELKKQIIELKK